MAPCPSPEQDDDTACATDDETARHHLWLTVGFVAVLLSLCCAYLFFTSRWADEGSSYRLAFWAHGDDDDDDDDDDVDGGRLLPRHAARSDAAHSRAERGRAPRESSDRHKSESSASGGGRSPSRGAGKEEDASSSSRASRLASPGAASGNTRWRPDGSKVDPSELARPRSTPLYPTLSSGGASGLSRAGDGLEIAPLQQRSGARSPYASPRAADGTSSLSAHEEPMGLSCSSPLCRSRRPPTRSTRCSSPMR
jgi:hypothetical protein